MGTSIYFPVTKNLIKTEENGHILLLNIELDDYQKMWFVVFVNDRMIGSRKIFFRDAFEIFKIALEVLKE